MSKPVKNMLISEYEARLEGVSDAALISLRGIGSNDTNAIRKTLREKEIRVLIVKNALARKAFEGTGLESLGAALEGSSALTYGEKSVVEVAREIVELLKNFPKIELKGAVLDGQLFSGEDGVRELSKYPTREEAIAKVVTLILSPHKSVVGAVASPGAKVVSIVKEISERLEKGESIERVA